MRLTENQIDPTAAPLIALKPDDSSGVELQACLGYLIDFTEHGRGIFDAEYGDVSNVVTPFQAKAHNDYLDQQYIDGLWKVQMGVSIGPFYAANKEVVEVKTFMGLVVARATRRRSTLHFIITGHNKDTWRKFETRITSAWRKGEDECLYFKLVAEGPYTPNIMPPPSPQEKQKGSSP